MASGLPALMGLPDSYELSNVDDPNCGLPYDVIEENVFANCFEFRIGGVDTLLSIEIPDSASVWPTIPADGVSRRYNRTQIENTIEEIVVSLTSGEDPLESQEVIISTAWIDGSGGHDHGAENDLISLPVQRMGWIVNTEENDSSHTYLEAVTDEEGEVRLRFRAPEFGGKIEILAQHILASDTLEARDTLTITVPDLVLLPASTEYQKIGGTASHNGPPLHTTDNNHYGTQEFVDSLLSIAQAWNNLADLDSIDADQAPLRINDMSLPNGGKFDVYGSWNSPHSFHRVGRDADIRTTRNLPENGGRIGVLLSRRIIAGEVQYTNLVFENLCSEKNATPQVHFTLRNNQRIGEHYHLYFY